MTTISAQFVGGIALGEYDEHLDQIIDLVRARQKETSRKRLATIRTGQTVRFSTTIRPKYLVGKTATVVKVNHQSIVVSCPDDPSYGRFQNSKNVRCPNSLIAGTA